MLLQLTHQTSVRDLCGEFSRQFPYLKLEFYSGRRPSGKGIEPDRKVPDTACLGEIANDFRPGTISIDPKDPAAVLEKRFREQCGLRVQLSRRCGDFWIRSSLTGHLNLMQLNQMGAEAFHPSHFNVHTLFL